MTLLLFCTMLLLGTPIKMDHSSENFRICKTLTDPNTDEPFLECMCDVRENFTVGYIFDFSIARVFIKGCGDVIIDFGSLKDLQLTEIEFVDLNKLTIFPFALSSIQGISVFKISDVAALNIMQHAFVGLNNIDKFIIRNVTANTIKSDAFSSISAVNQFLIEDSAFQEVEQFAFTIQNIITFNVINTEFHIMANHSLLLHNVKNVVFEKCVFHETENGSFVFSFVDSVSYKNCEFWEVETTAFQSNSLNVFSITNSYIENLKPDAFGGLDLQNSFVFTDNIVDIINETSFSGLFSTSFNELGLSYCCNTFICDCNIFWMWGLKDLDKNNTMLENSYCSGKKKYPVNSYKPIIDSKNNCITLELKSSIKEQSAEEDKITTECKSDDCLLSVISSAGWQIKLVFRTVLCTLIIIKLL
ncbi:uncharacterized protein LOC129960532 [Argiope bruennichi]|uniref:uncharacterized protein LOC129960532 n=1 Tax=Argiope bruennichi TaxID=94029 RepID=UPI0024944305|nr:uncharacterized protein LOC129960532 [Argiope bruennichi]